MPPIRLMHRMLVAPIAPCFVLAAAIESEVVPTSASAFLTDNTVR